MVTHIVLCKSEPHPDIPSVRFTLDLARRPTRYPSRWGIWRRFSRSKAWCGCSP